MKDGHYVIITPAWNEEKYLQYAVDSVAAQTIQPQQWVIVEGGSNEGIGKMTHAVAAKQLQIYVVQRTDCGFRQPGGGFIDLIAKFVCHRTFFYSLSDQIPGWVVAIHLRRKLTQ